MDGITLMIVGSLIGNLSFAWLVIIGSVTLYRAIRKKYRCEALAVWNMGVKICMDAR